MIRDCAFRQETPDPRYGLGLDTVHCFATQCMYDYNRGCSNMALGAITHKNDWPWSFNATSDSPLFRGNYHGKETR